MSFGEKLKAARTGARMSQTELAKALNISLRTIQNYEAGRSLPKQSEIYIRIGELFGVSTDYLLSDLDASKKTATSDNLSPRITPEAVKEMVRGVCDLFAGDELCEDDKDRIMRVINTHYWQAKDKRRKRSTADSILGLELDEIR